VTSSGSSTGIWISGSSAAAGDTTGLAAVTDHAAESSTARLRKFIQTSSPTTTANVP
jgi:hypothetical protein